MFQFWVPGIGWRNHCRSPFVKGGLGIRPGTNQTTAFQTNLLATTLGLWGLITI